MIVEINKSYLNGKIDISGSKSVGHRALICAFLSNLPQKISLNNNCEDIKSTIDCLESMGAKIDILQNKLFLNGTKEISENEMNCKESGSTLRFLLPLTTLIKDKVVFKVDTGLCVRPMFPYEIYFDLKKDFENNLIYATKNEETKIFEIEGNVSSQFISGLLFYMVLKNDVKIKVTTDIESRPYLDMTVDILKQYGVEIIEENNTFYVGKIKFKSLDYYVEPDYSAAANFIVYNLLTKNNIEIPKLPKTTKQADSVIYELINKIDNMEVVSLKNCPDLGPILFVYASFKNYEVTFVDCERLKIKESNRIESMKIELSKTGVYFYFDENKVVIKGKNIHSSNLVFDTHNDHRVAMALSIYALVNDGKIVINDAEVVKKSFPDFYGKLQELKANIKII